MEHEFIDAVVEVGTKRPARDSRLQILVRGTDQTHVHRNFAQPSDGFYSALLKGSQQLDLNFVAQVAHLVQEKRTALRRFESALLIGQRSREGAFDMAEKLRSGQFTRQSAAIDRHEGFARPFAAQMDQPGHVLLARAARPFEQHRHIGRSHQTDVFVQFTRSVAVPFDVIQFAFVQGPVPLPARFRGRRSHRCGCGHSRFGVRGIQRLADLAEQLVRLNGFGNIVPCAELHTHHGIADFGITGHHDHGYRHAPFGDPLQQIGPVPVGQTHVRKHQIVAPLREKPAPGGDVGSRLRSPSCRATCAASAKRLRRHL